MNNVHGVSVSFQGVRYEIKKSKLCGKPSIKEVLKGVSGMFSPGLNAIMGPTGSGKTSLLDVLAQRKDPKGLKEGLILINGQSPPPNFRLMSGYVVQDDVVMGTLSVRENLAFSANLRLSNKKFNSQARKDKVENVINQLGLESCADTLVGNEFVRGVSGGERKRVNIGMEMILDPPVLFLDEPTTGLDANTANTIILLLHKLAEEGRNIILSIHQPRYSIFSLFNKLILLQNGEIVFRGPAEFSVQYFKDIGFDCPQFHNPADYFLDILGGDSHSAQLLGQLNMKSQSSSKLIDVGESTTVSIDGTQGESSDNEKKLLELFERSQIAQEEEGKLQVLKSAHFSTSSDSKSSNSKVYDIGYANDFFIQLRAVMVRTFLNLIRNPLAIVFQTLVMAIFAVLVGLVYYQSDTSFKSGIQNRAGCFFFLITGQVMANLSALELFLKNRANFIHESASGYYRVSVYFVSQIFADLIPNRLIPNISYCLIIYFMIGFQQEVGKFFYFLLTIFLTAVCAASLAFFVSASVETFAVANIVVSLPYVLMMLFGGFLVNTGTFLNWLGWMKYLSIFRYGINALTINEMTGLVFIDNSSYPGFNSSSKTPCLSTVTHQIIPNCTTGEIYMDAQDIEHGEWQLWLNIIALAAIGAGFICLAYIQMRMVKKFK